jgi:hypothetical protein
MNTYTDKVRAAGYPDELLMVDFESYFSVDYTLTKMSTIEYIMHDEFEFTGVGWGASPNWHACFQFDVAKAIAGLQTRYGNNLERVTVVFKNAKFDATILVEKFGIECPYIIDIDDIARHYDSKMSHRLADLCTLFKVGNKGDTMQFKGLHLYDMDQQQLDALEEYCKNDIRKQARVFEILMEFLTWPEMEIPIARHTLGLYLEPRLHFDFKLGEELLGKMQSLLEEIMAPSGCDKKLLGSKIAFPEELQERLDDWCLTEKLDRELITMKANAKGNAMIPALSKSDEAMQKLMVHECKEVRELCLARIAVKSWPTHVKRVKSMIAQSFASYGLLRVPLHYHGCHTGRPSGGEKINLLNLGGKGRTGQGTHKLISMVRRLLIAPPGMTLVLNDSAQIECRLEMWLVGQSDLLIGFADGEDIYSEFATKLFGEYVRKSVDSDSGAEKKLFDLRRGFGKDAILGCGYGMGSDRFYNNCRSNPDLRPFFDDGTYTFAFVDRLIKTYRSTYSKVTKFWTHIEGLFKFVVRHPDEKVYYKRDGSSAYTPEGALLTLWCVGSMVHIMLPSGRVLYYRNSAVAKNGNIRWQYGHLYGALLTENIIQSIARDLLMLWIVECEKEDMPVVTHCYDEIVVLVNDEDAEASLDIMDQIMCEPPDWAPDVPLASEGMISKFYTK